MFHKYLISLRIIFIFNFYSVDYWVHPKKNSSAGPRDQQQSYNKLADTGHAESSLLIHKDRRRAQSVKNLVSLKKIKSIYLPLTIIVPT